MLDFETFPIRVQKVQGINVKGWEWPTSDSNLFPNGHWPQNHPHEKAAWLGLWNFRITEGRKGLLSCLTLGPVGKTPCFICWGEWKLISVTLRLAPWHLSKVPVEAQNQLRKKVKPAGGLQRKEVDCPRGELIKARLHFFCVCCLLSPQVGFLHTLAKSNRIYF